MDGETLGQRGISEAMVSVDSGSQRSYENSINIVDRNAPETLFVVRSEKDEKGDVNGENVNSNAISNVLGSNKASMGERKIEDSPDAKHSCIIDVKSGSSSGGGDGGGSGGGGNGGDGKLAENLDGERICRICHLSSDPSSETPPPPLPIATTTTTITVPALMTGLIQLGCGCKHDLGIVHVHCAEAWFKLKGNRQCEICGQTAKNVMGVGDNRFIEEWNDTRSSGAVTNLSDRGGRCWRGQPFCNFLMTCLVVAFVLPWFFRVNMF